MLGIKIIEAAHLTVSDFRIETRPWKKRIFSLPWRPFKDWELIYFDVPDPDYYLMPSSNIIMCHPAIAQRLRYELQRG